MRRLVVAAALLVAAFIPAAHAGAFAQRSYFYSYTQKGHVISVSVVCAGGGYRADYTEQGDRFVEPTIDALAADIETLSFTNPNGHIVDGFTLPNKAVTFLETAELCLP